MTVRVKCKIDEYFPNLTVSQRVEKYAWSQPEFSQIGCLQENGRIEYRGRNSWNYRGRSDSYYIGSERIIDILGITM